MKITPKIPIENDITNTNFLTEFFKLVISLVLLVIIFYLILTIVSNITIKFIPLSWEIDLFQNMFLSSIENEINDKNTRRLDSIFNKIKAFIYYKRTLGNVNIKVFAVKSKKINAAALPGGIIIVSDKLIDLCGSEDELIFIIGHELGHFYHRNHLKVMGKTIIIGIINLVFNISNINTYIINHVFNGLNLSYSRKEEIKADTYGGLLLKEMKGNVKSGILVFNKLKRIYNLGNFVYLFSTHPNFKMRIKHLESL